MGLASSVGKVPGVRVCAEAGTATRALEAVESSDADAVVLDVSLPRLGGMSFARALKRMHPRLRVIAVSPEGGRAQWEEALACGAHAFLLREDAARYLGNALAAKRPYLDPRLRPLKPQKRPRTARQILLPKPGR